MDAFDVSLGGTYYEAFPGGVMAPPVGVRARGRPRLLCEEVVERLHDVFDYPHELVHGWLNHASCHKLANGRRSFAETEWKRRWGAPCGVFWREGEVVQVLPRRLGSRGDAGLALKPPIARADERSLLVLVVE